ncbi:MAG: hypothetical protein ACUVQF_06300 [Fervidobacterium sp.]|uniref:hypothetical protein n=1 Tax=Fervidobacterium sp. TaxID=1871331 RepID=UPI0040495E96
MDYEFYFAFPMPPISILFIILRIFAIFVTIYTLFILVRFLTSPESGTDVGRRNEFDRKRYKNLRSLRTEADERLLKAFKVFNATPNDSYSDISVRYYYLRRMLSLSPLPLEVKEAKLKEIDELFEVITDYYTKK